MKPSLEGPVIQTVAATDRRPVTDAERLFWLQIRRARLLEISAIEDLLDLPRSVIPRRKRDAPHDDP